MNNSQDTKNLQPDQEPVAWLYTLEYGHHIANTLVSEVQRNYPFGVCGADYLAKNDDGISYVRQTPLYTSPPAQRTEERNFCPRCGKRAGDYIHTCTPPQEKYTYGTPLMDAIKGKP